MAKKKFIKKEAAEAMMKKKEEKPEGRKKPTAKGMREKMYGAKE